ncbi:unnamed protein product [Vicia faba]|uniref:Uncharacterized protein n=1 Tax=Vicia faba TaxID=3906 RepID=A0AAV1A1W3_VICFA|nr:unnamed protein product [Vicia faba]
MKLERDFRDCKKKVSSPLLLGTQSVLPAFFRFFRQLGGAVIIIFADLLLLLLFPRSSSLMTVHREPPRVSVRPSASSTGKLRWLFNGVGVPRKPEVQEVQQGSVFVVAQNHGRPDGSLGQLKPCSEILKEGTIRIPQVCSMTHINTVFLMESSYQYHPST